MSACDSCHREYETTVTRKERFSCTNCGAEWEDTESEIDWDHTSWPYMASKVKCSRCLAEWYVIYAPIRKEF